MHGRNNPQKTGKLQMGNRALGPRDSHLIPYTFSVVGGAGRIYEVCRGAKVIWNLIIWGVRVFRRERSSTQVMMLLVWESQLDNLWLIILGTFCLWLPNDWSLWDNWGIIEMAFSEESGDKQQSVPSAFLHPLQQLKTCFLKPTFSSYLIQAEEQVPSAWCVLWPITFSVELKSISHPTSHITL